MKGKGNKLGKRETGLGFAFLPFSSPPPSPPPPFNLLRLPRRIIVVFRTCHFAHVVCPQQVITEYLKTPKQRHVHHNDCTGPVQTYSDILYGIREFVVVLLRMNPMKMAAESATWRKRFPEWKVFKTLVCHSCVEDENETLIFENFDDTVSQHRKCFNPTECLKYFCFLVKYSALLSQNTTYMLWSAGPQPPVSKIEAFDDSTEVHNKNRGCSLNQYVNIFLGDTRHVREWRSGCTRQITRFHSDHRSQITDHKFSLRPNTFHPYLF